MSDLLEKVRAIQTEKNAKILPENIKSGVTIFDVTGTLEDSSGLSEVITEQEEIIDELKEAVKNKTGGPATTNIFVQEDEPTVKDGIWLKTNKEVEEIIEDDSVYASEEWNTDKMSELKNIPISFIDGGLANIGTDVYLLGGTGNDNYNTNYKYDILTDTYTKLTNIPRSFATNNPAVAIGTDIYLFGVHTNGSGYTTNNYSAYKYDTLTDTYIQLTNVPVDFREYATGVAIGTDIYLFYRDNAYRYNTLTDSYTTLSKCNYFTTSRKAIVIGTDIYLVTENMQKYDTNTDTYTTLTSIPIGWSYGDAIGVGTDIYLFGGGTDINSGAQYTYKYNTLTDTFTQLEDMPYLFNRSKEAFVNGDIYIFGGRGSYTKVQVMKIQPNTYPDNSIVIANNKANRYETKLVLTNITNGLKYHFNDFWYAETESDVTTFDTTIEKYVGDGTQWNKIN